MSGHPPTLPHVKKLVDLAQWALDVKVKSAVFHILRQATPRQLPAVVRCMKLLELLINDGEVSLKIAREAYKGGWSQRSYDRDLQTLRQAGVEVQSLGSRGNGLATVVKFIGFKGEKRSRRKKVE